MTVSRDDESAVERVVGRLMLIVFWSAFACLGLGLAFWIANRGNAWTAIMLSAGLLSLMLLPTLRLVAAIATAHRQRDWLTLSSTLAVLAILFALTLRDALALVR